MSSLRNGVISRVRDLGLSLAAVERMDVDARGRTE